MGPGDEEKPVPGQDDRQTATTSTVFALIPIIGVGGAILTLLGALTLPGNPGWFILGALLLLLIGGAVLLGFSRQRMGR